MKKLDAKLLLIILFIIPSTIFAQLSGTKVIGSAPSDYTTFTQAVNALQSQGISSSVVFNVKPGTYTEQISIQSISGVSPTKTITFQSQNNDSTSVILQFASSSSGTDNYTVQLDGSDYVIFRKMTLKRTGSLNFAQVVDISNGATHNSFLNNRIIGSAAGGTTTFLAVIGSTNAMDDSYNNISDNVIEGGSYGLYYMGRGSTLLEDGTLINNNQMINQSFKALYVLYQRSLKLNGNFISSTSTNTSFNGVYCQYCEDSLKMNYNWIEASAGYGIYLANCNQSSSIRGLLSNNIISVGGSSTANGIYLNNVRMECLYHNSINIYSTSTTDGRALWLNGAVTATLNIVNNILANTGGGYAYYIDASTGTPLSSSNYNDLYSSGTNVGYYKSSGNQANLIAWQSASGVDASSISADPVFISPSDLHSASGSVNSQATTSLSFFSITNDIDLQPRTPTPDIGADEFSIDDLGVSHVPAFNGICPGTGFNVAIYIKNYGVYPYSGNVAVYYQIQGMAPVNQIATSLNIPSGDSVLYTFGTLEVLASPGTFSISGGTTLAYDVNTGNDTIADGFVTVWPAVTVYAGPDQDLCLGDSVTFVASGTGINYEWSTAQTGTSITVIPSDTTIYYVTVTDANGCTAVDSVWANPAMFIIPVADFTYNAGGLYITFTNTSTNATTYLWDFGDGNTSTEQDPLHLYGGSGVYTVTLYASNPCYSDTTEQTFSVIGIDENVLMDGFSMYPNPAINVVNVRLPDQTLVLRLDIFDPSGKKVRTILCADVKDLTIDVSDLATGEYFIAIVTKYVTCFRPLMIRKL